MSIDLTKLVVFNYSGTLSIGTTLFGEKNSLMKAIKQSDLYSWGVKNEDIFWQKIVTPTWKEGSLTQVGYTSLIVKQVETIKGVTGNKEQQAMLRASATKFVDDYYGSGTIDPDWKEIFTILRTSKTQVIVTTDNYAEATDHIIAHLEHLGVASRPAFTKMDKYKTDVLVANAADGGFYTSDRSFWEKLKAHLMLDNVSRILVVDDFGLNEVERDSYSNQDKVETRLSEMSQALLSVFKQTPQQFQFFVQSLPNPTSKDINGIYIKAYKEKITEVKKSVFDFLSLKLPVDPIDQQPYSLAMTHEYETQEQLLVQLPDKVIKPVVAKVTGIDLDNEEYYNSAVIKDQDTHTIPVEVSRNTDLLLELGSFYATLYSLVMIHDPDPDYMGINDKLLLDRAIEEFLRKLSEDHKQLFAGDKVLVKNLVKNKSYRAAREFINQKSSEVSALLSDGREPPERIKALLATLPDVNI